MIGYRTDMFPAFWSRDSGHPIPVRFDSAEKIAQSHQLRAEMNLAGGQLIGNPIPQADEIPTETLQPHIEAALHRAEVNGIVGKDVTPFLLAEVLNLTEGRSLEANIALIRSNAALAAEIATCLTKLR